MSFPCHIFGVMDKDFFIQNNPKYLNPSHKMDVDIVELQWLKHFWNHENMFETGVVRANEC